ncbi:MAG: RraA family protein [Alphaproteobacteria bacterium]|nr:RraA family protein [Alphaproteobacteria bacterium]
MTAATLDEQDLAALRAIDTPTVCNALELVAPSRRAQGFTTRPLVCVFPTLPPMVGYAKTATVRAREPGARAGATLRAHRFAYFEYLAEGPRPCVSVIQDIDSPRPGFGAFWGEVNTTVHKALGCLGTVTNGSVRDLTTSAAGFQLLAGSVGPSHGWIHLVDFGGQVNVAGMVVNPGDLIHADCHGAVVIPHAVARAVPEAAAKLARREAVILTACREPGFTLDKLKQAIGRADEIH